MRIRSFKKVNQYVVRRMAKSGMTFSEFRKTKEDFMLRPGKRKMAKFVLYGNSMPEGLWVNVKSYSLQEPP